MVWLKNPSKTIIPKIKVRLPKKQSIRSYRTLLWIKTEILAYEFFDQSENSLCKLKTFHKWAYAKIVLFPSTCSRHFWPFCWGFERTWNGVFSRSVLGLKTSKYLGISGILSTRICKTSPFSASDLKLAIKTIGQLVKLVLIYWERLWNNVIHFILVSSLLTLNMTFILHFVLLPFWVTWNMLWLVNYWVRCSGVVL